MAFCAISLGLASCADNKTVKIKIDEDTGVYSVPAKVNGLNLNFIFDTGASNVCISLTEAMFMAKNGYLSEDDIEGSAFAQLADGTVSENTEITLRTIEVGDIKIYNIPALIVHNLEAPLLLGQSAIRKLGRIEFDGDYLYIHNSSSTRNSDSEGYVYSEENQNELDSLLRLTHDEYINADYVFAIRHLKEARRLALNYGVSNRNWELDYIDGKIKSKTASGVFSVWKESMPLYCSSFHGNETKENGLVVMMSDLLNTYAYGLSQHFSRDGEHLTYSNKLQEEEEFTDVVSLMTDDRYSAYYYSAMFYEDNFNLAQKYCERAIALDSTKSYAFQVLGSVYLFTNNDKENAKCYYNQAIELAETNHQKGFYLRLLALCMPRNSESYYNHLKQSARLGDMEAQRLLRRDNINW